MYLDRVETIEHARFRALAQIMLVSGADDQGAGTEAFEDYMKYAFPNLESKKVNKQKMMMEALKEWTGLGPLNVTPMAMPTMKGRSRMVQRISGIETGDVDEVVGKVGGIRTR